MALTIFIEEDEQLIKILAVDKKLNGGNGKPYLDYELVSTATLKNMLEYMIDNARERLIVRHRRHISRLKGEPCGATVICGTAFISGFSHEESNQPSHVGSDEGCEGTFSARKGYEKPFY